MVVWQNQREPADVDRAVNPQEYSYTNMWLMSTVNSILFGELWAGSGERAANVGYTMWDEFYKYRSNDSLDFVSHLQS